MRLTRRSLLGAFAGAAWARSPRLRYCVCNETFAGSAFPEACRLARSTGYSGLEIAPDTLAPDPASISTAQAREYRRIMASEGVEYAGLHALVTPRSGLHLTTPDDQLRRRSWEYMRRLIDLATALGDKPVMVLGSGRPRAAVAGSTPADARARLRDGLAAVSPAAQQSGALILIEPLSPQFTNVVNTLAEAVALVREIGSPAVSSMFDTHNTVAETERHDALIRKYSAYIRHVHVNELDGRHPGTGGYDFALLLRALRAIDYRGWVSLEVFDFRPSGEQVARDAMTYLRRFEGKGR